MTVVTCIECHATGSVFENSPCESCNGSGYMNVGDHQKPDIVQIVPTPIIKPMFHGKLAFVDEVTNWGLKAHIETFDGDAHVRLAWGTFVYIGKAAFLKEDDEENI